MSTHQKHYNQASRVHQLLLELSPLVDAVLPIMNGLDAPPIANKIKRCIDDMNDKINAKRVCRGEEEKEEFEEEKEEREVESLVDCRSPSDSDAAPLEPEDVQAKARPRPRPSLGGRRTVIASLLLIAHIAICLTVFTL
jgi:hypothetical protein